MIKKPEPPKCMLNQDHGLYSNQWRPVGTPIIPIFCKKFLFHSWRTVYFTGLNTYQECRKCGRKRVVLDRYCFQPIKKEWKDEVRIER